MPPIINNGSAIKGYKNQKLDIRAAINHIKIDSQPYGVYSYSDIIPYGQDNLYP